MGAEEMGGLVGLLGEKTTIQPTRGTHIKEKKRLTRGWGQLGTRDGLNPKNGIPSY